VLHYGSQEIFIKQLSSVLLQALHSLPCGACAALFPNYAVASFTSFIAQFILPFGEGYQEIRRSERRLSGYQNIRIKLNPES
jgi:hypothetical protein